jgi:predicted  nucleic acid-binding Zn-ribbon protein
VNLGKQLYDLQQIDLDLYAKAEKVEEIESQLSDNKGLANAQAELEGKQNHLVELEKEQKTADWKLEDLQAKRNPLQEKLFAGSVKNPKELLSLEQQLESLKPRIRNEEDMILEIMSQIEWLQKEITLKAAEVGRLKKERQKRKAELLAKQRDLIASVDIAKQKRDGLVATMEPGHLEIYETLRAKKQGQAVAKIEQGRCQGCRITLPMSELQQARLGELVQCGSCNRILCSG